MTAQAETSSATLPVTRPVSSAALTWHGVRAGLLGALAIAVWFLFIDFGRGRPLHTPALLGMKVFGGGGILPPALSFTLVHVAVFVALGIVAARLVALIEGGVRRAWLVALLLFIVLDLGFAAFALSARAIGLEALSWADVLLGNALAAALMIVHLWRNRPQAET